MNDKIYQSRQSSHYSDMSIWDIHRTQVSLLAWLRRDIMADVITSLEDIMKEGGDLPRWPIANGMFCVQSTCRVVCGITDWSCCSVQLALYAYTPVHKYICCILQ